MQSYVHVEINMVCTWKKTNNNNNNNDYEIEEIIFHSKTDKLSFGDIINK